MRALAPYLVALTLLPFAGPARAAQSYDSCQYTITTLPVVISSQGTWCLKSDVQSGLASGDIVTVATNNVTIDCNGFKLGNLAAGAGTQATGIRATGRSNVTVRGCNLRGFRNGVVLTGTGHLVEDNRIETSRFVAVQVVGDTNIVRRNVISETGGSGVNAIAVRAVGSFDVLDNLIDTVYPNNDPGPTLVVGIQVDGPSQYAIRGNTLRGLTRFHDQAVARGIALDLGEGDVIDNAIAGVGPPAGSAAGPAITCPVNSYVGFLRENRVTGFWAISDFCAVPSGYGNQVRY